MRQIKTDWRIIVVYLVLIVTGIPWYWPAGNTTKLLGMPAWVTIAVFISILASFFTAFLLLFYTWPGEEQVNSKKKNE